MNRLFAASDHMIQKPPYWRANCPLGHLKQRKFKLIKLLCFRCPSAQFVLQWPIVLNSFFQLSTVEELDFLRFGRVVSVGL